METLFVLIAAVGSFTCLGMMYLLPVIAPYVLYKRPKHFSYGGKVVLVLVATICFGCAGYGMYLIGELL